MSGRRPNHYQRRLDAILDEFRDKEIRPGAERRHLLRLWREFVSPMRVRLFAAILLTLIVQAQPYAWAFMAKVTADLILMVNGHIPTQELHTHFVWVLWLFCANSGYHILLTYAIWQSTYQITLIGQRVVFELRKSLHEKLQALPLSFFDGIQTGKLLSVVLDDVETIRQSVAGTGVRVVSSLVTLLLGTLLVCWQDWRTGLLVLCALPAYVLTFRYFRPRIRDASIAARRATAILYSRMEERVTGVRTVKVFGRERAEVRTFTESVNNLARLNIHIVRQSNWLNLIATAVSVCTTGFVLYMGFLKVQHGDLNPLTHQAWTIGDAMMLYTNAGTMFSPALIIGDLIMELQRISVVMRRVFDILEAQPEPPDRADAVALTDARGEICFDGVTFTYPGDETPTLREISACVPAGKQVAVMGPSGSGKSSLLYLLMRFYDPDAGTITLDGRDLRDVKLLALRDRITLVMQEPVIFSGTVAENIRYGRLDAKDAEVRRAAKDADLHEFVMSLPDGYETLVGERGMSLSGGQRQRLALAASLLSRPSVLLLDDTTSALDPSTEARVRKTLNRLMAGRTCFVVTHRVSTALASDLVLVLEDGAVTQFGAPTDLLAEDGLFRRIYEQQQRESADTAMAG
jgi:subfamily B ATP-binding cassette protein MsbA